MDLRKKILIVEDNSMNRMMLCEILASEYEVLEAENGKEALDVLEKHKETISLILLDIVMPVMDGYTFLSIIKGDSSLSSIPVIVTTQSDGESDEVAALSHGATDFVAKPYKPQIILHRVASIINLRESAAMVNLLQYDRLTGLYSKDFFYSRVKDILIQNPDKQYDIICSDIENFKLINDVFGTSMGDRVLREVAGMFRKLIKNFGICGRLNADRFACIIERRWDYTDEMFDSAGKKLRVLTQAESLVIKWGIYHVEGKSVTVEQMCDRALLAACGIKGIYGKYFAPYDDELREKLLHQQAITDSMEYALEQGQFEVYLQPKYKISDDSLAGAEALVRWDHPEWGIQLPNEFIPLFEQNGFITKLDQFVWNGACSALKEWDNKGFEPISVSVNVSRADIYNADLTDILIKIIKKHGLQPSRLHLEITESAYTEDPERIINTVDSLRKLGFIIEMDDFGSGYSSLSMLNKMPLDILKLDMKFIQSETAKPIDQSILCFIMELARSMNLSVVAEGVETKEQLSRLREIGCDYVQGYYFARPMRSADFELLLAEQSREKPGDVKAEGLRKREKHGIILIADEDELYEKSVLETFEAQYELYGAGDVQSALDFINNNKSELCAVILSMTLPQNGGFSVLSHMANDKDAWNIPIIATGPFDGSLEDAAFRMGADEYVGKPHSQASLLKRVRRAIGLSASRERERVLEDEAYRDYLTGALNRRGLDVAIGKMRKEDMPAAVFLFDLDNLKRTNDMLGHDCGDMLIRKFVKLLHQYASDSDVAARFGGDEFILISKRTSSSKAALEKGEEICRGFCRMCLKEEIDASASGGIVVWASDEPAEVIIKRADQALYRAKSESKGGCCLWEK